MELALTNQLASVADFRVVFASNCVQKCNETLISVKSKIFYYKILENHNLFTH